MAVEARKVQQVSYSTLVVSIPRQWANEVGLKKGDVVTFRKDDDGSLRIFPGLEHERKEIVKCIIDADKCHENELLTRILTGSFILGRDTVQVVSKKELTTTHLDEIRNTVKRLTGLGIVEQTLNKVIIQSFVDSSKFPVDGLIRRLHLIGSSMQKTAIEALTRNRPDLAKEVIHMEEEVDRIYWLIVRQSLLAARDKAIAKRIGVESPLHVVGNRVVAKSLEEMADNSENIAKEVLKLKLSRNTAQHKETFAELVQLNDLIQNVSDKVMKAFFSRDIKLANDAIETVKLAEEQERKLSEKILTGVKDLNLAVTLRVVLWNLGQIARSCDVIGEITMNRVLEESSDVARLEVEPT